MWTLNDFEIFFWIFNSKIYVNYEFELKFICEFQIYVEKFFEFRTRKKLKQFVRILIVFENSKFEDPLSLNLTITMSRLS